MVEAPGTDLSPPGKPGVKGSYAVTAWIVLPVFAVTLAVLLWSPPILWLIYGIYAIGLVTSVRCVLDAQRWWSKSTYGLLTCAYLWVGWRVMESGVRDLLR